MYRKKYNPEESLQRIKLMMGYSLNNTLKENAKNLGVLISEQVDISADIRDIKDEIKSFNSDEDLLLSIIKKYNNKSDFQKLLNSYKERYNIDLGVDLYKAINSNDKTESAEIIKHLAGLGVTAKADSIGDKRGTFAWIFQMGNNQDSKQISDRQQNINNIFCSVKDGIITNPSSKSNGKTWESWKSLYKVTDTEIETAKASCGKKDSVQQDKKQVSVPNELKNADGIKKFQDWLDMNKSGWATGYTGGVLKGAGGYGKFGPRTRKAWDLHKSEYLSGATTKAEVKPEVKTEPEVPSEVITINPQSDF
jgi:hypothetical protein